MEPIPKLLQQLRDSPKNNKKYKACQLSLEKNIRQYISNHKTLTNIRANIYQADNSAIVQ